MEAGRPISVTSMTESLQADMRNIMGQLHDEKKRY
jgi:hypothetical protein